MSAATADPRSTRLPRVTDDDIETCRTPDGLVRALGILGLVTAEGDAVVCPQCGKPAAVGKKFKIQPDGGYKHYGATGCWAGKGAGIDLLKAAPLNLSFPDAVRAIVGKPTSVPVAVPDQLPQVKVSTFRAKVDPEVFRGVLNYGRKAFDGAAVTAAQEFYGQWHIDPAVVAASGAVYITRPDHLAEALLHRFGLDRLLACGLFVLNKNDQPMCLISKKWPVVEPARDATGAVVNLQFRASNAQYARYLAHKAGKLPYEGNQKFVQLKGINPGMVNIDAVAALPPGSQVSMVEGFKDRLSAATLGAHAVGIPGVSFRPSEAELAVLRHHKVVISLDGDAAGHAGVWGTVRTDSDGKPVTGPDGNPVVARQGLHGYLVDHGVETYVHPLTGDMDITDRLVETHARGGCGCAACDQIRGRLGL